MQQTNPKNLRAELRDYLELAATEPIRILRRSGDAYILMSEENFEKMRSEIYSLQRRLLGITEALAGHVTEYQPATDQDLKKILEEE